MPILVSTLAASPRPARLPRPAAASSPWFPTGTLGSGSAAESKIRARTFPRPPHERGQKSIIPRASGNDGGRRGRPEVRASPWDCCEGARASGTVLATLALSEARTMPPASKPQASAFTVVRTSDHGEGHQCQANSNFGRSFGQALRWQSPNFRLLQHRRPRPGGMSARGGAGCRSSLLNLGHDPPATTPQPGSDVDFLPAGTLMRSARACAIMSAARTLCRPTSVPALGLKRGPRVRNSDHGENHHRRPSRKQVRASDKLHGGKARTSGRLAVKA